MKTHDGLELAVCPRGPDDAPVTVVLAHCWTADMEDWQYQVRDLLDRFGHDVRVLTWDHRGHGASDPAPLRSCTIENLGRDMAEVIDQYAGTGRLVIAGHSIGGMATMALAEERPDILGRTDGVLFVSTSCGDLDKVTLGLPEAGRWSRRRSPGCWPRAHGSCRAGSAAATPGSRVRSCTASCSASRCGCGTAAW